MWPNEAMSHDVVVLTASATPFEWQVLAAGTSAWMSTMLVVRTEGRVVLNAGFEGPALYAGDVVNEWRGRETGTPFFVLARLHRSIVGVTAISHQGLAVPVPISSLHPGFGLRFAAAPLPDGHEPGELHLSRESAETIAVRTPVPPVFPVITEKTALDQSPDNHGLHPRCASGTLTDRWIGADSHRPASTATDRLAAKH
jgi:hypothetical protein